jgi:hypothetical protein
MVRLNGIEATLDKLYQAGVYLSIDEFKGRKETIRGSQRFYFDNKHFDNPYLAGHMEGSSSGTRSSGTRTIYEFNFIRDNRAIMASCILDILDANDIPLAMWLPILPGSGPMHLLSYAKAGKIPSKWFSPVNNMDFMPAVKDRLGTGYLVYAGRLLSQKWPIPEHVPVADSLTVANWIAKTIKVFGGCSLHTYVSMAVRVCQAAYAHGLDMRGTRFIVSSEPLTEKKSREIESTGAIVYCRYGLAEAGIVGCGCINSTTADDVHLTKDSFAVIQQKRGASHAQIEVDAFYLTNLLSSSPKILFNVETGDYGSSETRDCGCKLGELGLTEHLYHIRSFDKMTSSGMTFIGTDLARIIEEVLPSIFGGSSIDYQMVEEEDGNGRTLLKVIVSPNVGNIDEAVLVETVLNNIARGGSNQRMMSHILAQTSAISVERAKPLLTRGHKFLPLHMKNNDELR